VVATSAPYTIVLTRPLWRARVGAVLLAACLATSPAVLRALDCPARPIKLIVPYPAGGITGILQRIMGEWLTGKWGQPVIVDNRPGAAGNIGAEAAFKAEPDGYTVMVSCLRANLGSAFARCDSPARTTNWPSDMGLGS
jgi:tripartite-type tricarboxylate transporter receptor subunit TctC